MEELKIRIDDAHKGFITPNNMLPIYVHDMTGENIKDLFEHYGHFLTFIERDHLEKYINRWKQTFTDMSEKQ